jgi:hypothetical protein
MPYSISPAPLIAPWQISGAVVALKFEMAVVPIDDLRETPHAVSDVRAALFLDEDRDWNVIFQASHQAAIGRVVIAVRWILAFWK